MSDVKRKRSSANFEARLLAESSSLCPLCSKYLLGEKNGRIMKLYKIAHIYPHSPTAEQLTALKNVTKPKEVESFENLITLCSDCHDRQDFHTTAEDYMLLYDLKQKIMNQDKAIDNASKVPLETQIKEVLQKLNAVDVTELLPLSYAPVIVERKINLNNNLLRKKIKDAVVQYFPFVQKLFSELDDIGKHKFDKIANEIKLCFLNMNEQNLSQEDIFNGIVKWLQNKTQKQHNIACEIIVAFFVQNCEVFNEIAE